MAKITWPTLRWNWLTFTCSRSVSKPEPKIAAAGVRQNDLAAMCSKKPESTLSCGSVLPL